MLYKFNCLLLFPLIIWIILVGNQLTSLMSKGKYPESGLIFAALLGLSLVQGHYGQVLQPQANALEKNLLLLLVDIIPIIFIIPAFFLFKQIGLAGFIGLQYCGSIARDFVLIRFFKRLDIPYHFNWRESGKMLTAFFLTVVLLSFVITDSLSILQLGFSGIAALIIFWILSLMLRILNREEISALKKIFPFLPLTDQLKT